jgi:hypothetical protein
MNPNADSISADSISAATSSGDPVPHFDIWTVVENSKKGAIKPYRPHIPCRPILTATNLAAIKKEKAKKRKSIKQNNIYAAMKEEGTLHGEKIEGSKYAIFLASRNDSRNDSYAAMKEEGTLHGEKIEFLSLFKSARSS